MGNFIWHEWARFVSITASVYAVWASFWGFFYRKFFWDFVGGILRNPGGLQPAKSALPFVAVIVKIPLVQIFAITTGIALLTLEVAPFMKRTNLYRSWIIRMVLLFQQAFLCMLFYQGTNAAVYSVIAIFAYAQAQYRGERIDDTKASSGILDRA